MIKSRPVGMVELAKLLGVVRRTPNMMKSRGKITTTKVGRRMVVIPDLKTLTFIWNWMVHHKLPAKVESSPVKAPTPLPKVDHVKPIFSPRNPVEKKLVGKRRLVHRDVAHKYLRMSEKKFEKFSCENFDEMEFVRGIGYWPAELLETYKAKRG